MWSKRSMFSLSVVLVLGLTGANVGATEELPNRSQHLFWQVDPDGDGPIEAGHKVEGSSVEISRADDGVEFTISTTGLQEGHGYTVWFFSYDFPENCTTGDGNEGTRCTLADFFTPGTFASIMWGRSGHFVTGSAATFQGSRPRNTSPCITEPAVVDENCSGVLLGHGLHNPQSAEIHFVLRDHGPDQEGIEDETSTINGGCDPATHHGLPVFGPGWGTPGNYPCFDPQGNN